MSFHQSGAIRYYQFELFDGLDLVHAVITRHGGVSPAPWASLNVGGTVGDSVENVIENRRRSFAALNRQIETLFDVWQIHSDDVVIADAPRPPAEAHRKADIILTDKPSVTLYMRFADCTPIYLYDPIHKAVGLAHAGWIGTVKKVAAAAVKAMQERYASRAEDLLAGIGPSICVDHYPVGPEVVIKVEEAYGSDAQGLLKQKNGQVHFDLWAANHLALEQCGVKNIQVSQICTACNVDDWFSHRAENGKTGRFGGLIALKT
jgi:YfiH family protein